MRAREGSRAGGDWKVSLTPASAPTLGAEADAIPGEGSKAGGRAPHSWPPVPKDLPWAPGVTAQAPWTLGEWRIPNLRQSQCRPTPREEACPLPTQ